MASPELVIGIGANMKELERQMKAAAALSGRAADEIEAKFRKANPAAALGINALAGVIKGAVAAITIDKLIRDFASANAELVKMGETAKRVGLDLTRFQELKFAGLQNGLTGQQFGTGLEGLAEKLNEARQEENKLSQLFADNNIKLKDRQGNLISINQALSQVAELTRNAATEFDKIKIAEAVGLTRDWVPLLEQGGDAIATAAGKAREAGVIIDSETIQKAKEFEREWASAIERWSAIFKSNIGGIIGLIDTVIGKASQLYGAIDGYARKLSALNDVEKNGFAGASRDTTMFSAEKFRAAGEALPPSLQGRLDFFNEQDRETARGGGFARIRQKEAPARGGARTNTSSLFGGKGGGGGGGGGGKSEEEGAQDRLDRYIEGLMRQRAVMEAEIATVGKSNAEKKAAIEIAKAQVDLEKLSSTAKQEYIDKLTKEVALNEEVRASKERLEAAQKGLNDATQYFGNAAVDALEDLVINGAKAEDVVKRLAASLAKAALQAVLIGEGPLAGIFGTKGVGGAAGGLLGGLVGGFGKAAGGQVRPGQAYTVGERGPERFMPMTPGRIIPNGRGGGGVTISQSPTYQITQSPGMSPEAVVAAIAAYDKTLDRSLPGRIAVAQARFG